jgi:hypothetical protein
MVSVTAAVHAPVALASDLTAAAVDHCEAPDIAAIGTNAAGAGADRRPALSRIERSHDDETRIVHDAVRIFECRSERSLQGNADGMVRDIDGRGGRQARSADETVIDQQPHTQGPGRALVRMRGDRKAHRPHQMRRDRQPDVAFGQRRADAQKATPLQHREIAMDEAWGR